MLLKNKVAVIYGASGAIGSAVAYAFASKGAEVFVVTDSSKFGRIHLTNLFNPRDIRCLITDAGIPEKDKRFLEETGVQVIIA